MTWLAIRAMLGTAWGFLKSIPWQAWAIAAAAALALWYGERRYDAGEQAVQQLWNEEIAAAQRALVYENAKNRSAELRMAEQLAAAAAKFEEDKARAIQDTRNAVLADLRAGRLQLRISRCDSPDRSGQAPAAAGLSDDAAAVRGENPLDLAVADSIALAAEADAHIKACQSVITAYRGPQ